jgi:hypothetical protein
MLFCLFGHHLQEAVAAPARVISMRALDSSSTDHPNRNPWRGSWHNRQLPRLTWLCASPERDLPRLWPVLVEIHASPLPVC